MKFEEALKAMREGKKVKRAKWRNISSIWINKNNGEICTDDKLYDRVMSFAEITADDWEICEEIERKNVMNFEEVRKALFEGKKVRCTFWAEGVYIYFDDKNMVVRDNNDDIQTYGIYKFLKDREWEFYEEKPKPDIIVEVCYSTHEIKSVTVNGVKMAGKARFLIV